MKSITLNNRIQSEATEKDFLHIIYYIIYLIYNTELT